jgi:hypothetical protein
MKPTFVCKVCQYQWTPRPGSLEQGRTKPVQCPNPKCQSRDWEGD